MEKINNFMKKWEDSLNADEELWLRNRDKASTLEGKVAIKLNINGIGHYSVNIKDGKFQINRGVFHNPLLCWDLPISLFQEVLLNKQPVLYALLDERGNLSFNTSHFTHFNGSSIIEMFYLAQELVKKDAEARQFIQQLGEKA